MLNKILSFHHLCGKYIRISALITGEKRHILVPTRQFFRSVKRVLSHIKVCEFSSQAQSFWQTCKSARKPFLWDVLYVFCDSSLKFIIIFRTTIWKSYVCWIKLKAFSHTFKSGDLAATAPFGRTQVLQEKVVLYPNVKEKKRKLTTERIQFSNDNSRLR